MSQIYYIDDNGNPKQLPVVEVTRYPAPIAIKALDKFYRI